MNLNRRNGVVFPVIVAMAAGVALGGGAGGPSAAIAKKKRDRRVGTYQGTTELGGTVSFTITRNRYVVGFTMPNVPVDCFVVEQGNPNPPHYSKPPFTITAPPMKLQGVAKFGYEVPVDDSGPFQGVHVDGKPDQTITVGTTALKGNATMISWNGPYFQVGTEMCRTAYVDWSANKVGGRKK